MMKSYTAYCMNEDGENMCMTREYNSKKDFINDLHGNGYKVHFVALTDKYDEESEKYNARRIQKNREAKIRRDLAKQWKERDRKAAEKLAEETTEEPKDEQTATEQPEETPDFETVKNQLFAKVEHIREGFNFPKDSEYFGKQYGDDIALTVWLDNGTAKPEQLRRETIYEWIDKHDITILDRVINTAIENTMTEQKPRLHRNIFDFDAEPLEACALLEKFFRLKKLDDDKTVLLTTTENRKGGAIAAFYPPALSKICELFGGSGFYVAFTSLYEAMIHKLGSIDPASIRRNVRETNRIFDSKDTLSNDVWFYDPSTKQLAVVPE